MKHDPSSKTRQGERDRKRRSPRVSVTLPDDAIRWAEEDAKSAGTSVPRVLAQIVTSAKSRGVSLLSVLGTIPQIAPISGGVVPPMGGVVPPRNGRVPTLAFKSKAAAAAASPRASGKADRRIAAEELLRRRTSADPTWSPSTTRARYLRGLESKLADEEVAELLAERRDRLAAEASIKSEAKLNEETRLDRARAEADRSILLATLDEGQLEDLDRACRISANMLALAGGGNRLAVERLEEQRLAGIDSWLERQHQTPVSETPEDMPCK